jgi:hypothetical protein
MAKRYNMPELPRNDLREALRTVTMETAGFGFPTDYVQPLHKNTDGTFQPIGEPVQITDFIREKTHCWRSTWIEDPLRRILRWVEGGSSNRYEYWKD